MADDNFKRDMLLLIIVMTAISFILGILSDIQDYLLDKMGLWLTVLVIVVLGVIIKINK